MPFESLAHQQGHERFFSSCAALARRFQDTESMDVIM